MTTKWEQSGDLWPGIIAVKPFTAQYEATYRADRHLFRTYKEAEQWILQKKDEEIAASKRAKILGA